ncbi:TorD/DmsD family molecular chaperone [Salipiger aestuarii]|uniref:TorD/DmsD family molecular chaperone n=1 Tax=Salipiger aestuarii TaxID=568098 RepID=UPI00123C0AC0|nr:molecular chaperone TorD family protein [Salipiger aestuarii]
MNVATLNDAQLKPYARLAEWIGEIFLAPPSAETVERMAAGSGRTLLGDVGEILNCRDAARQMEATLLAAVGQDLSARYVRLFDGVSGRRTVSLYESFYCGNGSRLFQTPVDEMRKILRRLDMSVRAGCHEPPDHLSIELAALAAALDKGDDDTALALQNRMEAWIPQMRARLDAQDQDGFYSSAAVVVTCLLNEIGAARSASSL